MDQLKKKGERTSMIDGDIFRLIKQLNNSLREYENCRRFSQDITPAQSVLLEYMLSQQKTEFFASQIYRETGFSKATVSSLLKGLKRQGYLTMEEVSEDERKKRIRLTPKAFGLSAALLDHRKQIQQVLCAGIGADEMEMIRRGLEKMCMNIKTDRSRRMKYV